jgi:ribosomal subunit interface protein
MQMPLQVTFRSMAHSDALAAHVERRVAKLDHLFRGIISCHVVVELAGHHQRHGERYRLLINLGLPGHELVVNHAPPDDANLENAHATADRAFDEAGRQLEEWMKRRRVRRHDESRRAT